MIVSYPVQYGCTYPWSPSYNKEAVIDDGQCVREFSFAFTSDLGKCMTTKCDTEAMNCNLEVICLFVHSCTY